MASERAGGVWHQWTQERPRPRRHAWSGCRIESCRKDRLGEKDLRCRTGNPRRGLPSPNTDRYVPPGRPLSPKGSPHPVSPRPEGRCPTTASPKTGAEGGKETEVSPETAATRPDQRTRRFEGPPSCISVRAEALGRGPHPPLSGAFTCKKMLARIDGSDNTKLRNRSRILCIISPELHISFTSCPQLCPQVVVAAGAVALCGGAATLDSGLGAAALQQEAKRGSLGPLVDLCCAAV